MLKIPHFIHADLIAHARAGFPLEVCGILGGRDGVVERVFRMTNTDASNEHFMMEPREQFAVVKELRAAGLEMTGDLPLPSRIPGPPFGRGYPPRPDTGGFLRHRLGYEYGAAGAEVVQDRWRPCDAGSGGNFLILTEPPFRLAGAQWTFWETDGQMFERSEFLPVPKTSAERREPAQRANRMGCPFSAYSFWASKKSKAAAGGATPGFCL